MSAIQHACSVCNKQVESFVARGLDHEHKGHIFCLRKSQKGDQLQCRICHANIKGFVDNLSLSLISRVTVLKLDIENHQTQANGLQGEVDAIRRALGNPAESTP